MAKTIEFTRVSGLTASVSRNDKGKGKVVVVAHYSIEGAEMSLPRSMDLTSKIPSGILTVLGQALDKAQVEAEKAEGIIIV